MRAPNYAATPWHPWHTCLMGQAHRADLRNCQDATIVREGTRLTARSMGATGRYIVGAVSDGVGSHRSSEVGARVTVATAAAVVTEALTRGRKPAAIEAALAKELPQALGRLARLCGDEWQECCYATLVIAVGTLDWFAVWACGDGYLSVNGAPPQVTGVTARDRLPIDYQYRPEVDSDGRPRPPMLERLIELPTREVRGAWISTDGARYLTADGRPWRDYLGEPLPLAPPVLEGWKAMEAWGEAQYDGARGQGRLMDDIGLVAFVPRE